MDSRMRAMKAAALEAAARGGASMREVDVREQKIDAVIEEIKERREFLEDMRARGRGEQYEAQIRSEISSRLHELKKLGQDVTPGRASLAAVAQGGAKGISTIGMGDPALRR